MGRTFKNRMDLAKNIFYILDLPETFFNYTFSK